MKIDTNAFNTCTGLITINLPANLEEIGLRAFANCSSLKEVIVPEGVTVLNYGVFSYSGLQEVSLPESLTLIEERAFEGL